MVGNLRLRREPYTRFGIEIQAFVHHVSDFLAAAAFGGLSLEGLKEWWHADIEMDWNTPVGRALIVRWSQLTGFWERLKPSTSIQT